MEHVVQKSMSTITNLLPSSRKNVLLSLFLAMFSIVLIVVISKRKSKARGNALLLVGAPDAGKTVILSALVYGQALLTHTSLQTNSSIASLSPKKHIRVIDVPGHPRIRDQFKDHLNDAKIIAFVVDASTVSRNGAIVAEHLHHILHTITSLPPSQSPPSLIILAHKCDLLSTGSQVNTATDSVAINRVRTILERELEKRRASHAGGVGVDSLGAENETSELGGLDTIGPAGASTFKFADWEGGEISFSGTFSKITKQGHDPEKPGEDGLISFREWLDENI